MHARYNCSPVIVVVFVFYRDGNIACFMVSGTRVLGFRTFYTNTCRLVDESHALSAK